VENVTEEDARVLEALVDVQCQPFAGASLIQNESDAARAAAAAEGTADDTQEIEDDRGSADAEPQLAGEAKCDSGGGPDWLPDHMQDLDSGFDLVFRFAENPYFENRSLVKRVWTVEREPAFSRARPIRWKPGQDYTHVTTRKMSKKHKRKVEVHKPVVSFFHFFSATSTLCYEEAYRQLEDDVARGPGAGPPRGGSRSPRGSRSALPGVDLSSGSVAAYESALADLQLVLSLVHEAVPDAVVWYIGQGRSDVVAGHRQSLGGDDVSEEFGSGSSGGGLSGLR